MTGVRAVAGGVELLLHVQPRAAKTGFAGPHGDRLKVRVAAPPVDDAANRELIRFLAEFFDLAGRDVELVSGDHDRRKVVRLRGLSLARAIAELGQAGAG